MGGQHVDLYDESDRAGFEVHTADVGVAVAVGEGEEADAIAACGLQRVGGSFGEVDDLHGASVPYC